MKNIFFFILILANSITLNANAEIAYIDINKILNISEVGKYLNSHVQKKNTEYSKKFKLIEDELIKQEKSLLAQQNILNKEEFDSKLKNLTNEVQSYRKDKKLQIENLKKFRIEKTKEILKQLNPIITNFVEKNSISIVLPKKNIIVGKKNLDITDKILKLLNENIVQLNLQNE